MFLMGMITFYLGIDVKFAGWKLSIYAHQQAPRGRPPRLSSLLSLEQMPTTAFDKLRPRLPRNIEQIRSKPIKRY